MIITNFSDIQTDFLDQIQKAVYCNMATVDRKGRPRSRIMHPVWEGPIGWVISWPDSHKAKHLAFNPWITLAYIHDKNKPVYIDASAEWIEDINEKKRIWNLHKKISPPLGFDPKPHYENIHNPYYGILKFTPWRIELGNLEGEPRIWRPK